MQKVNKESKLMVPVTDRKAATKYNVNFKLNAPSLIKYFNASFFDKTGYEYTLCGSRSRLSQTLKQSILDHFILNGWEINKLIEFVDWVFINKKPEGWVLHWLPNYFSDWSNLQSVQKMQAIATSVPVADKPVQIKIAHREEVDFIEYLGNGIFDDMLTKTQYWVGLRWREINLSKDALAKIAARHRRYPAGVQARLEQWEYELGLVVHSFNPMKQLYIEFAYSHKYTLGASLKKLGREVYSTMYTEQELAAIPEKPE